MVLLALVWWRVPSRASVVLVELLIVSRCLLHSPLRSTGEWRRQRRSCAWAPWMWCQARSARLVPAQRGVVVVVHSATGGVADIVPSDAHRIGTNIGSRLPRNPRCAASGVEGQAATGHGVVSDRQAERRLRRRGAFRRGA